MTWRRKVALSGAVSAPTCEDRPFHAPKPRSLIRNKAEKKTAPLLKLVPINRRTPNPAPPLVTLLPTAGNKPGQDRFPLTTLKSLAPDPPYPQFDGVLLLTGPPMFK